MRQYEIWWAALPEPIGTRPVLLLTRTGAYAYLTRVLAVEITSRIRGIPQEVVLGRREGLSRRCVASFDNLRTVPVAVLSEQVGAIASSRVVEIKRALGHALGWIELAEL